MLDSIPHPSWDSYLLVPTDFDDFLSGVYALIGNERGESGQISVMTVVPLPQ